MSQADKDFLRTISERDELIRIATEAIAEVKRPGVAVRQLRAYLVVLAERDAPELARIDGLMKEYAKPACSLHTCPYKEEINNDFTTLCECDDAARHECAMDI